MSIDLGKVTMKKRLGRGGGDGPFSSSIWASSLNLTGSDFFGSSSCLRKDAGNLEVWGREGESRKKGFWRVSILLPTDGDSPRCPLSSPISGWTWPLQHEKKSLGEKRDDQIMQITKLFNILRKSFNGFAFYPLFQPPLIFEGRKFTLFNHCIFFFSIWEQRSFCVLFS